MNFKKYVRLFGVMVLFFCILTSTAAATDKITAVRTIGTASVNPGETFQVTVVLTGGDEDLISIALDEDLPDGWVVETVQDDGFSYRAVEQQWLLGTATLYAGGSRTIIYDVTVPVDECGDNYIIPGSVSARKDMVPPVGYMYDVSGDANVEVLGEKKFTSIDWNPWNDMDSPNDAKITTSELQAAINCCLNNLPAPITHADVTTNRLQTLVHYWLSDGDCPKYVGN
jgi:hypothetical protein